MLFRDSQIGRSLASILAFTMICTVGLTGCGSGEQKKKANQVRAPQNLADMTLTLRPEYEPIQTVMVSDQILSYDKAAFLKALTERDIELWMFTTPSRQTSASNALAAQGILSEHVKFFPIVTDTVWMRDYGPLSLLDESGKELVFADQQYYPDRPEDDRAPEAIAMATATPRIDVPLANEGGNLLCAGDRCFVTERVLAAAQQRNPALTDVRATTDLILSTYRSRIGMEFDDVLPRLPGEGTGHIDMWAIFLGDENVAIGEITDQALALARPDERQLAAAVKTFLDQRAGWFATQGYQVERVPMPLPTDNVFRSYTNSLLVNDGRDKVVLVPRYVRPDRSSRSERNDVGGRPRRRFTKTAYPDAALLGQYEKAVEAVYEAHGFEVIWIDSDDVIRDGGALHCISMQMAAPR